MLAQPYTSGVRYSGMSDDLDIRPTTAQIAAAQAERDARRARYAASARGRFLAALARIRQEHEGVAEYEAATWKASDCWSRGFADADRPASERELHVAQLHLSSIPGQAATDARVALVEIGLDKKRDSLSQGAFVARDNARPEARRSAGGEA